MYIERSIRTGYCIIYREQVKLEGVEKESG